MHFCASRTSLDWRFLSGALCLFMLAASGCAKLSTDHLQRKAWADGPKQQLTTKFFRFEYQGVPLADQYGVKGQAFPLRDKLPAWADGVEGLSLMVYLSDDQGNVLAKDQKSYLPRRLGDAGIPFDFFLKYAPTKNQAVFLSFGYLSKFVATKPPKSAGGTSAGGAAPGQYVFFASEDAALKQ